ncbi:MAG TPA: U32 family peptidase [Pirellulales bacterium]|nr:U32 family peptidase [Pirellulales bacterium]
MHLQASPPTELLAPAGDWLALRAAVANGADAVYFGLSNFNARHRATNFTLDELPDVVGYLHRHNVRGYVTCNTLIFSDELPEISRWIAAVAEAGADAVIVQDLGLARLISRLAPGLPVHGSTQMTLTEPRGIEFVRRLGIERVILARELSLDDIARVREQTDLPVEVFVHGALCVAYSGQCLTSEALGGRSANRGQCAQACRLPYDLLVDGEHRELGEYAYLLSPQDLAGHDKVGELVRLGVASLKIEGRLKSAQYVATTTQVYRRALDAVQQGENFHVTRQEQLDLSQSFSRGFTPGFLEGTNHQRLVHGRFPKARGVQIGAVVECRGSRVLIELAAGHRQVDSLAKIIKPGDGVVFDEGHPEQDEQGGRVQSVQYGTGGQWQVELSFHAGSVNTAAIVPGALVWKTDDPAYRRRMDQSYARDCVPRKLPLAVRLEGEPGGPLRARCSVGRHEVVVAWAGPLQVARRHALSESLVREQFGRLGETQFALAAIDMRITVPVMAPKSVLNDLRRRAVSELMALQTAAMRDREVRSTALDELRREVHRPAGSSAGATPRLFVLVRTREQLESVCAWSASADDQCAAGSKLLPRPTMVYCDFEDVRRYRDAVLAARASTLPIGLATLRIIKPGEEGLLAKIAAAEPDVVLVRNLTALSWFRERAPAVRLVGDFSLNVANELTADLLLRAGVERLVPSYDLNWEQLAAMLGRVAAERFEQVIHQHVPMFHMEHCVFAAALSQGKDWRDCGRPCDRHRLELRDRVGAEFPLLADTGCRNTVFNSLAQSAAEYVPRMLKLGLRHFRVELLREDAAQTQTLLTRYWRVLAGLDEGKSAWRGLQVLNQIGLTRGTLSAR